MKSKAQKPSRIVRKKRPTAKPLASTRNGKSSPYGFRAAEMEWMNKHSEKLRPLAGEYIVVEGTRIVAHSADASIAMREAKRKGVVIPFVLYLEPLSSLDHAHIGL